MESLVSVNLNFIAKILENRKNQNHKLRQIAHDLVDELNNNFYICKLLQIKELTPKQAIKRFSTAKYKKARIYNFDHIKNKEIKVKNINQYKNTRFMHWHGKKTHDLIESIFTKIIEAKINLKLAPKSDKIMWSVRVENIGRKLDILFRQK